MKRGFTLVELLVVMAIVLILAGGIFYAYREIFQKGTSQALVAKNEQEAQFLISTLVSELSSVGFGIDGSRLQILNNGTNLNDVGNSLIAISGSEVRFLSLATRQDANIGCWGYADANGNITTQAIDYLGRPCTISQNRICLEPITKITRSCANTLAFDIGDNNTYPDSFITRYYLGTNPTASRLCADGTQTLMKRVGSDGQQPIVDCVAYFRVRYIVLGQNGNIEYRDCVPNNTNWTCSGDGEPEDDINNLIGLRLCMLLQVGGRQSVAMDVPQLSDTCGNLTSIPDWRYYRWSVIEVDIPLKNIR